MRTGSPSTDITKLLSTFTSHSRTSLNPFHPVVAFGTLLVFSSSDKFDKIFISLVESIIDLVLRTSHTLVINAFALQAVVFTASWASVVVKVLFDLKHSCTACGWTPSCWPIFFHKFVKTEFLELFFQFRICVLLNVTDFYNTATFFEGAFDICFTIIDLWF